MSLNANQKRAVEYLDGPLLVLAGPGTGKTQLLSHKVAYILKNTDTNPDNILCLTFTETGAKNMRERLKSIIGKDALKVNIGTYHAFGSDILAMYKNYSDTYDRRLDAAIDEVTQYKIIKSIQDKLPGTDILKGDSIRDIISVIGETKSAGLSEKDLKKVAEKNIEDSEVLSNAISPLLQNVVPRAFKESYDNAYAPIFEILKKYDNLKPIVGNVERIIVGMTRDLKEAIVEAEDEESVKPLTDWRNKYFEKDQKGLYRLKDRVANKKLLSVAKIMSDYEKYLRDNGLFDFNDMIEEAATILSNDIGFKMTLQEKYQFIMLDEFQDTNPSQFMIVKKLTDYENPMIMAVGDDDQAIYEFQGALSSNLTDFQEHYSANVIPLTENYRSTQEILDFSHQIIAQAPDRFADKELTAHQNNPSESQIQRYEFSSSDGEYGFVASEVAKLIASGVPQSEIAIISYKAKYFEPLLPYLKSYDNIKIAYEKRDNLFENEEIHAIITILRFIHEMATSKHSSIQILEVLTYPFFGLSPLSVIREINTAKMNKKPYFNTLCESDDMQIAEVMKFFSDLIAKSFNESLEMMINYVIGSTNLNGFTSPFLDYYTKIGAEQSAYQIADNNSKISDVKAYRTFKLYENIASLRGKLTRHFGEKPLKLGDLVEMVEDYEAAGMPMNTTSPYKDADEAVQVLTAHKAKGLEFKYVFVISADHTAWGKGKGNNNLLVLPKNLMQIRHTGTTDGEKLRILYVALTRAKFGLYITNSLHDFNGKSPERLEYLEEYVMDDEVISPFLPNKKVKLMYGWEDFTILKDNLQNWLTPFLNLSPDMRAIYQERVSKWRMSASALTSFIDIVYAGPETFFKSYVLQAPREPDTESLVFGNLIHQTFEAVTNLHLDKEKALQFFMEQVEKLDVDAEMLKNVIDRGRRDLEISLNAFSDILNVGKAEVDFAPDKIVVDGVPITGKIDHIIVDEDKKTIEIYDFKTAGFHKEKWQSHATLYKYMLQLQFYKMLLNNSPRYKKYKVERAHILFVVPDRDGEVYDKVYEFNADDEAEFRILVSAVYELVSSLKFMEDDEVFLQPDEKRGIKDIREFIALLLAKSGSK